MGTRSYIAYKNKDGKYVASYCHWDGYLDGVGLKLYKHYDTFDKVKKLVDKGQMSSLGQYFGKPSGHSFDNPVDGYTVYYGRDRGEKDVGPMVVDDISDLDNQYNYIFIDGKWFFKTNVGNKLMELEPQFNVKKRVRNPTIRGFLKGKHSKKTIFNYVYSKILEQGKPGLSETGKSCVYRSPNGCKCAIGHLISDKDLTKVLSESPWVNSSRIFELMIQLKAPVDLNDEKISDRLSFLDELRLAHDSASHIKKNGNYVKSDEKTFIKTYRKKMDKLAAQYGF